MIEQIDKKTIMEKTKRSIQKSNELWDNIDKVSSTGILSISLILSLFVLGKAFLFLAFILFGIQRLLYHGKFFEDEDTKN